MYNSYKIDEHKILFDTAEKLYNQSYENDLSDFPMSERRKFYETGNRSDFEKLYFCRRDFLSACAVLALFDSSYILQLETIITAVCDEYCWALPAHTDGTEDGDSEALDLFSAETAFTLAEISYVFDDKLSDDVRARIKLEIKKRLVDNYTSNRYWWENCNMNWAAVCGGCVGGALIYLFPEEFAFQKDRILRTLSGYIDGFPDDGACLEGASYWLYGFSHFVYFADIILRFSKGEIDLLGSEKIKKIATYIQTVFLKGNTTVSFSDGDMNSKAYFALQSYLANRFPDSVRLLPPENTTISCGNTKWINLYRSLLWSNSKNSLHSEGATYYFPSAQQVIINKRDFSFAIKGGSNNEPHNHNDLGSFIFSDSDGQVFCDLGAGRYVKDYFKDDTRYDIFCNSSYSHNVPIIGGKGQMAGEKYTATLTYKNDTVTCDITGAYDEGNLISLVRSAAVNDSSVVLTDTFDIKGENILTERFVSLRKAEFSGGELIFGRSRLKYPTDKVELKISTEKHTPHEYDKEDITVYCYDFTLRKDVREVSFEITTE